MKSILKKVTGLALSAALVFGMISCSSEADNNAALIGILNSSKGNSGTPVMQTVATPAFSVASGAVNSGTEVTITCGTEGAKIYYTTDGTEPTAESTEYTCAISITEAVTVKAIAVKDGMNNSAVASVSYTISSGNIPKGFVKVKGTTITGTEEWTPTSNVFVSGRTITIPDMYVCDHEVTRGEFKEVMGTDPSAASAYDKDGNELTGDAVLNNPVNDVNWYDAIAYCNKLSLKENLTPCYSVSGVTDWENLAYNSIPTSRNSTWDALTYDKEADGYRLPTEAEWEWLARGGENYTYAGSDTDDDAAWNSFNTNYTGSREVKTKKANGYGLYDMSGNVYEWCYDWADDWYGTSSGSTRVYRGGFWGRSDYGCQVSYPGGGMIPNFGKPSHGFRVVCSSSKGNSGTPVMQTVAIPEFSIASGAVDSGTEVTISCSTEGAKIYYTTDGSEPTASSTEYTSAISVTAVVTLKAIAVKSGMNDSAVASVSYTIKVATPAFSVASGAVDSGTEVTITCATEGAKIYYTTDGTEPTAESTEYTVAISVTEAVTLKVIAVKSGMNDSVVASVSYTISSGNIPEGFVEVTGTTITGNESWTPSSEVFVSGRSITIPDMYVCDHEVTRGEFKEVMGTDPSAASAYDKDGNELTGDAVLNNPVNDVNWYDAIAYCNKLSLKENLTPCYSVSGVTDWENLAYNSIPTSRNSTWDALTYDKEADGYRLPTEAEWEWLARGGENYTYAGSDTDDDAAWNSFNTNYTGSREVKTKKANGYGLYDMSGNVYEWCYDWYGTVSSSTADTGASSGSYRVQRGGSCDFPNGNCRVSFRGFFFNPYRRDGWHGFRVVRSSSK